MPIDRHLFKSPVKDKECPPWPCPDCGKGRFVLVADSLSSTDTAASRKARSDEDWYPDWLEERFVAQLVCNNTDCKTPGVVVGEATNDQDADEDGEVYWYTYYEPKFIIPAPHLFPIPSKCPKAVMERLSEAFRLFWCDPAACVSRMRSAIELLLDELKVKRNIISSNHKSVRLTLDARIKLFCASKPKYQELEEHFLAAKWIGNEGAHSLGIKREDVFDVCDILQFVLDEVVGERAAFVKRISKEINKQKGPRKEKKRKIEWSKILSEEIEKPE